MKDFSVGMETISQEIVVWCGPVEWPDSTMNSMQYLSVACILFRMRNPHAAIVQPIIPLEVVPNQGANPSLGFLDTSYMKSSI